MSGVKLSRTIEQWVEVQAECKSCGMPLASECIKGVVEALVFVKVAPCWNCLNHTARGREEQVCGATIHREGVRS